MRRIVLQSLPFLLALLAAVPGRATDLLDEATRADGALEVRVRSRCRLALDGDPRACDM
jgi:hypothetical protein